MKKKIIALAVATALLAIAVIGGTYAYLTDTDSAKNVMTIGKVAITQNEYQRDGNGGLEAFEQEKTALPAVLYDADGNLVDGSEWITSYDKFFASDDLVTFADGANSVYLPNNKQIRNFVDKIVTVKNTADQDVWVRTIIYVKDDANGTVLDNINPLFDELWDEYRVWLYGDDTIQIGDDYYWAVSCTYEYELAAGAESAPSLFGYYINPAIDDATDLPEEIEIYALSQAVQSEGFDNPVTALNAAFGEVTVDNAAAWLEDSGILAN